MLAWRTFGMKFIIGICCADCQRTNFFPSLQFFFSSSSSSFSSPSCILHNLRVVLFCRPSRKKLEQTFVTLILFFIYYSLFVHASSFRLPSSRVLSFYLELVVIINASSLIMLPKMALFSWLVFTLFALHIPPPPPPQNRHKKTWKSHKKPQPAEASKQRKQ